VRLTTSSRRGRLTTRIPEEGEAIQVGQEVARLEEPGLAEDGQDIERQISQVHARDETRLQEIEKLKAQFAGVSSEERRIGRLVGDGVSPAANLESLQHQREAIAADIRAREAEKGQLAAEEQALQVRLEKVRHFEKEGTLNASTGGTVLTRHHRMGEWVEPGQPIVTLQIETPYRVPSRFPRSGSPPSSSARP
jgi:multidrug resistance efflux pump